MVKWLFAWFNSVETKAMHGIHCKIQLQLSIKDTNNSSVPCVDNCFAIHTYETSMKATPKGAKSPAKYK